MIKALRPTIVLLVFMTVLIGGIYPTVALVLGKSFFSDQSKGSLVTNHSGITVGSKLLGQTFKRDGFFWSRSIDQNNKTFLVSGSRNLNPSNPILIENTALKISLMQEAHPRKAAMPVPSDLVLSSGSGLDPHISPEAAFYQADRVARARKMGVSIVEKLIRDHTIEKTFGFIGERRINVLMLNLALENLTGASYGK